MVKIFQYDITPPSKKTNPQNTFVCNSSPEVVGNMQLTPVVTLPVDINSVEGHTSNSD